MPESTDDPAPYRVSYSGTVRDALRAFGVAAWRTGQGEEAASVVKELDHRLRIYPQFGEPLMDLAQESGQIYLGTVPPLNVRYAVYEDRRLVLVAVVRVLPRMGE